MELTKHQETARAFIEALSIYPSFIPDGTKAEGGDDLREQLDDQLHEFASEMGIGAAIEWHDPKHGHTNQIAIDRDVLTGIQSCSIALGALVEQTPLTDETSNTFKQLQAQTDKAAEHHE